MLYLWVFFFFFFFFFQAEDGIRDIGVTGVQTCALPILARPGRPRTKNPGMRIFSRNTARARSAWSGGESRNGVRCGGQGVRKADPCRGDAGGVHADADEPAEGLDRKSVV